jgi:hypothetical protein
MTNLDPRADRAVRDAVDAFMEGRLVPDFAGETVFETKNSRYRLRDGVIYAAPDASLVGAELVGWLCESQRRCLVESAWQHGARAVLVDRSRGRNIIVTSTTRLLHMEEPGAPLPAPSLPTDFRSWHPPHLDAPIEPFSPRHAPIIASTPPPPIAAPPEPPPSAPPKRTIPPPVAIPNPSPLASLATPLDAAPKRAAVHLPPRPIAPIAPIAPRPLPAPMPPPRRSSPLPVATSTKVVVPSAPTGLASVDAVGETPWELTSAELEVVEPLSLDPITMPRPPQADDGGACQAEDAIPFELARRVTEEITGDGSEPFPLLHAIDAGPQSPRK